MIWFDTMWEWPCISFGPNWYWTL